MARAVSGRARLEDELIALVLAAAITAESTLAKAQGNPASIGAPALQEKTGFQSEREHVCGRPRALRRCG